MGIYNRDYMREPSRGLSGPGWSVVGWLIAANVAVFLVQHLLLDQAQPEGGFQLADLVEGRPYTLLTSLFVHGGVIHLAFNMLMLYFVGKELLARIGVRHFLLVYFLGGLAGTFLEATVRYFQDVPITQIGASGAIMALVCALGTLIPRHRFSFLLFFIIPINTTMRTFVMVLIGLDLTLGLLSLVNPGGGGLMGAAVAHFAHLGGACWGLCYGWMILGRQQSRKNSRQRRLKLLPPPEEEDEEAELQPVSGAEADRLEGSRREQRAVPAGRQGASQVDAILDKMLAEGPKSLTEAERQILEEESRRLAAKRKS